MKTSEKWITIAVSLVGASAGLWGAYTAHDAARFKQPFDEHGQLANSFQLQIASAEKRKDAKEVARVRLLYEKFEEGWREGRKIAGIVASFETLASTRLSEKDLAELNKLISSSPNKSDLNLPQKTLGAAYLALGQYDNAIQHLKVASTNTNDAKTFALQSVAFGELAKDAPTEASKNKYENLAAESFRAALLSPSAKPVELSRFANSNVDLKAILSRNGVKLTDQPSRPASAGN